MSGAWDNAMTVLSVWRRDPFGLGGVHLRARAGPVRDAFLEEAKRAMEHLPLIRLHPSMTDDALFGGLDVAATLATGERTLSAGLLAKPGLIVVTMAERLSPDMAGRLGQVLDAGRHAMLLLDEGTEDEGAPSGLTDRLAFHINLETLSVRDLPLGGSAAQAPTTSHNKDNTIRVNIPFASCGLMATEDALPHGEDGGLPAPIGGASSERAHGPRSIDREEMHALVSCAETLGISGLRPPIHAARVAALLGGGTEELELAAKLVLGPRAQVMPTPPDEAAPPPVQSPDDNQSGPGEDVAQSDRLVDAARTAIPADLLAALASGAKRDGSGASGAGSRKLGLRRGRPKPSRRGRPDGRARIDLLATLRAAAPWQKLRKGRAGQKIRIRPSDIHIKRYETHSDRLLVFAVDASGSAAHSRLAEAKGAVELLLAEAYAARDHVALVSYRGEGAELLLPPTRSLVLTKKRLAALPGGGGTPLAAGLRLALTTALAAERKGLSPAIVLAGDGRANIALHGGPGRTEAREDAEGVARLAGARGIPGVLIDMSRRPEPQLAAIAGLMGARYLPLPVADATAISDAVQKGLAR